MLTYAVGWARTRYANKTPPEPTTTISVIVPARNEAATIGACLQALQSQDYPAGLLEIVVVDDHSEDETYSIATASACPNTKVLSLASYLGADDRTGAFKKRALAAGIQSTSGALIVTTDADCTAPRGWLRQVAQAYEAGADFVIAPVAYTPVRTVCDVFQTLDFAGMQGITAAAHSLHLGAMCNGANLAFSRTVYNRVGGYTGTDHLASGDDYLLLRKVQTAGGRTAFVKSPAAIVETAPQRGWRAFLQQRIRWASKSGKYSDPRLTGILLFVYAYNLFLLVLAVLTVVSPAKYGGLITAAAAVKIVAEAAMLFPVLRFFRQARLLLAFPFLQPLHVLYVVAAGAFGALGTYRWKGRRVR